jgi:hypothetical protein
LRLNLGKPKGICSPPKQNWFDGSSTNLIIRAAKTANTTLAAGIYDIPELFDQQRVFIGWLFQIGSKLPKSIDFTPTPGSAH